MRTGINLESKVLSVSNTFGIPTIANRSYVMDAVFSGRGRHRVDVPLWGSGRSSSKGPPLQSQACAYFLFLFFCLFVKGIRAVLFFTSEIQATNCEGEAEGPPFGVVKPNEDFALEPALSLSPCPLARPLRLTTTVTDPDPSQPVAYRSNRKLAFIYYSFVSLPQLMLFFCSCVPCRLRVWVRVLVSTIVTSRGVACMCTFE
jgi:hypothetical protein